MTKKDLKKVEQVVDKVLQDMIGEDDGLALQGHEEAQFSIATLQEMEAYLGHSIDFMGIS